MTNTVRIKCNLGKSGNLGKSVFFFNILTNVLCPCSKLLFDLLHFAAENHNRNVFWAPSVSLYLLIRGQKLANYAEQVTLVSPMMFFLVCRTLGIEFENIHVWITFSRARRIHSSDTASVGNTEPTELQQQQL